MGGKRLFQSVAEQIAGLIDGGLFPPGSRLPGERELAERLGVSRVTIREAEIALQAMGRLQIKTGSGVYVSEQRPADLTELPKVSAFEVTEARLLFEAEAAALAAQHITDEEIETLGKLIDQMRTSVGEDADKADEEFHRTIAVASKNSAILHTIQSLWRMREDIPDVKAAYEAVCVHDGEMRMQEHRAVFDALRDRNPAAAREAMRDHFRRLIENMLDATERQALEEVQKRASQSRERFLSAANLG
jgi:DNA-binding FadR family transcriptional regulator